MKLRHLTLFFLLINVVQGQELIVPLDRLHDYLPGRKTHLTVDGASFDPLRMDLVRTKEKKGLSAEDQGHINAIKMALETRGIEGIVLGRGSLESKVLIDGHVFSTADEIQFANDKGELIPIHEGRSVLLLEINQDKGVFLVSGKDTDLKSVENGIQFEMVWEDFFKC